MLLVCLPLFGQDVATDKITVLINEFPPLVIREQEAFKGFDVDLWNKIADRLKVETEFEHVHATATTRTGQHVDHEWACQLKHRESRAQRLVKLPRSHDGCTSGPPDS